MSAELPPTIQLCFNHRAVGDWDIQSFTSWFVPRVGDSVWVPDLREFRSVEQVHVVMPSQDAMDVRLQVMVHLRDEST